MSAHKLTNGNCYLDSNTLVGKFTDVEFPDLKYKFTDFNSLGMLGDLELPSGFEKMTAKLKFNMFFVSEFTKATAPDRPVSLTFRGNQESYENGNTTSQNVTITLTGIGKNFPMGQFKKNTETNLDIEFAVYSAKVVVGGVTLMEYDVFTNTFKLNGRDINANWKLNT